jgi:hypothetical protein
MKSEPGFVILVSFYPLYSSVFDKKKYRPDSLMMHGPSLGKHCGLRGN